MPRPKKRCYKFREGSPFPQGEAQLAGECLYSAFGDEDFSTDEIVTLARSRKGKAIRKLVIDCPVKEAAEKHYKHMARMLTNSLVIEGTDLPWWVSIKPSKVKVNHPDKRSYMAIETAHASHALWESFTDEVESTFNYWKEKLRSLTDDRKLRKIFTLFDELEKEISNAQKKVRNKSARSKKGK